MKEYIEVIECRACDSKNCYGCNILTLAEMLNNGAFDGMMDEHHSIIPAAEVVERKRGELGEKVKYAFGSIAWYNGHSEWLCEMADKLESKESGFFSSPGDMVWLTDRHALWMMLVGMFGNWGTSIRSGWIEDTKAAAAFIREATQEFRDAIEEEADHV